MHVLFLTFSCCFMRIFYDSEIFARVFSEMLDFRNEKVFLAGSIYVNGWGV